MSGANVVTWTIVPSPVGPLRVVECAEAPLAVQFTERPAHTVWTVAVRGPLPAVPLREGRCPRTEDWLAAYFAAPPFPAPPPLPRHLARWMPISAAAWAVWRAMRTIPPGETRSYDELARRTRLIPRLVGRHVAGNPLALLLPCHRVVGKRGGLVGYAGGLEVKRWLLDHELRGAGVRLT